MRQQIIEKKKVNLRRSGGERRGIFGCMCDLNSRNLQPCYVQVYLPRFVQGRYQDSFFISHHINTFIITTSAYIKMEMLDQITHICVCFK